jgi:hypothetical protein
MALPKWVEKKENLSNKQKSLNQEAACAKRFNGRTTYASGALFFDKGDCVFDNLRVELKRTDKDGLYVEKKWIEKLKREILPREFYAMEIEIQDERMYLIPENQFEFVRWIINATPEEIITAMKEGVK